MFARLIMLFTFTIAFTALTNPGAIAATPSEKLIDKTISQLVELYSDGIASAVVTKDQHIKFGKIFGQDATDAAVFFSLEGFSGGNGHAEYLAFFESVAPDKIAGRSTKPYRLVAVTQIGGSDWRSFDWESAKLGASAVTLSGNKMGAKDAMCCPSVPISVTFRIKEGFITESK